MWKEHKDLIIGYSIIAILFAVFWVFGRETCTCLCEDSGMVGALSMMCMGITAFIMGIWSTIRTQKKKLSKLRYIFIAPALTFGLLIVIMILDDLFMILKFLIS